MFILYMHEALFINYSWKWMRFLLETGEKFLPYDTLSSDWWIPVQSHYFLGRDELNIQVIIFTYLSILSR